MKLSFEKGLLTIASASQELGEGTETLDVELRRRAALDRIERPVPPRFSRGSRDGEGAPRAQGREHAVPLPARGRHRGRFPLHVRRHADAALIRQRNRLQLFELTTQRLPQSLPGPRFLRRRRHARHGRERPGQDEPARGGRARCAGSAPSAARPASEMAPRRRALRDRGTVSGRRGDRAHRASTWSREEGRAFCARRQDRRVPRGLGARAGRLPRARAPRDSSRARPPRAGASSTGSSSGSRPGGRRRPGRATPRR